jgi:Asp-tRNA(Asn)/Glu-tRNA(Gln) amidotransferase B subunit
MKAEQVVNHVLSDLCSRDVIKLLDSGEEKQARAVMKMTGMSKTDMDKTVKEHEEMKKQTDLEEAVDLVEELLDWTHLDDMIKDYKKKSDKEDDWFLGCCISLRGQALDFLKKHGREEK